MLYCLPHESARVCSAGMWAASEWGHEWGHERGGPPAKQSAITVPGAPSAYGGRDIPTEMHTGGPCATRGQF